MSAKWTLDTLAMQEDFFADTALIGIASALPAYRFCWLLNKHFDMHFRREPDLDVCLQSTGRQLFFPIYQYLPHLSGTKHLIYKLKNDKETLLPEAKQLDYLWMIQSNTSDADAQNIMQNLRNIADIQLAQVLSVDRLKSLDHLII